MKKLSPIAEVSEKYSQNPIIKALCQLIPGWGSVDTLLQYRADEIKKERLFTFFDELEKGNKELSPALIKSNDFLHCFFATTRAALNSRRKEKIQMFARLLINSIPLTNADEYEELLNILDELTYTPLMILSIITENGPHAQGFDIMRKIVKWDSEKGESQYNTKGDYLVSAAIEKLLALKVIAIIEKQSIDAIMLDNIRTGTRFYYFSPLGRKFISLIINKETNSIF